MDTNNKAPSFLSNVLTVIFAQVVVKLLGFAYRIINTATPGFAAGGNSIYSVGFNIYTALLAISSIGIPNAISKLVAERCALDDFKGAMRIFKVALVIFFLLGSFLSLAMYLSAEAISAFMRVNAVYTIKVLSPAVMLVSVSSVIRGFFAGQQNMKATNTSQVLEQFLKSLSSILIVYSMSVVFNIRRPEFLAAGATLATTLSTALSLFYLFIFYKANKKDIKEKVAAAPSIQLKGKTSSIVKTILAVSIPFSLAAVAAAINRLIDSFTVVRCLMTSMKDISADPKFLAKSANSLNGLLSTVDPLINLPLALTIAFSTVLVPTVTAAFTKKDYKTAEEKISLSLLLSIIISLPCIAGYMALSTPVMHTLFPSVIKEIGAISEIQANGPLLFSIVSFSIFFSAMYQTMSGSLQGMGKIYIPATSVFIGGIVKLILNLILISNPKIHIYGAGVSAVACQATAFFISFCVLKKNLPMKLSFTKYVLKPFLAAAVMGGGVLGISTFLIPKLGNLLTLFISIGCGVIIYGAMVIALKIFSREELSALPIIGKKFK